MIPTARPHAAGMLALFLAACFGAAALGALFPPDAWFQDLRKPDWQPPNAVFGPVWTVLYGLIAVAGWRVWRTPDGPLRSRALGLYALQWVLNAAWSPVFFGAHRMDLALGVITALVLAVLALIWSARQVDRLAAALLLPYLAWLLFASVLNATLWQLNAVA